MIFLWLALTAQFTSVDFDPKANYRTIETEHFSIHFDQKLELTASRLADLAEPIYSRITQKFNWEPGSKTHLVLTDQTDESNGLSTPLPYNTIYLFASPPDEDSSLDLYDDWLKSLLTHEFTHTVHIDEVGGIHKILRAILGRIWVPNSAEQQWLIEGLAEWNETVETDFGGRGRSPWIDMYLRTVSLEDRFFPIDRATYWNDIWPYGNTAYWYGIGFHRFLAMKYGQAKFFEYAKATARQLVPGAANFATNDVYGKSFSRLWEEWKIDEKAKADRLAALKVTDHFTSEPVFSKNENAQLTNPPAWSPDGTKLYAVARIDHEKNLYEFDFSSGQPKRKMDSSTPDAFRTIDVDENGVLYFSSITKKMPFTEPYDLKVSLFDRKVKPLTREAQLRDPRIGGDFIYALQVSQFRSSIVRFPKPGVLKTWPQDPYAQIPRLSKNDPRIETIYEAPSYLKISRPEPSPDGKSILFSMRDESGQVDLYLFDLNAKQLRRLTDDTDDKKNPSFSPDGNYIIFTAARKFNGLSVAIPNLYAFRLADQKLFQLTDSLKGAHWGAVSSKNEIAFGAFSSEGYRLHKMKFDPEHSPLVQDFRPPTDPLRGPFIRENSSALKPTKAYGVGSTLLPRFVLPFFFYTANDTVFGLQTGSNDPLGFHSWSGVAYHFFTPERPGAILNYSYAGWSPFIFGLQGFSSIANTGQIYASAAVPPTFPYYYERRNGGSLSLGSSIFSDGIRTGLSISESIYYYHKSAVPSYPRGATSVTQNYTQNGTGTVYTNILSGPKEGHLAGSITTLEYKKGMGASPESITPESGYQIQLTNDVVPAGKFKSLTDMLKSKGYYAFSPYHGFAGRAAVGIQWLKPQFVRTFSLGGSIGESPITSVGSRDFALRGLPAAELQGEGIFHGSLEYRFSLFRHIPGFGTAPIWFKNLTTAFFSDAGQTFFWKKNLNLLEVVRQDFPQKFAFNRFTVSAGAELRSQISVMYAPPLTFRLGYGRVIALRGKWFKSPTLDQIYFLAGTSF